MIPLLLASNVLLVLLLVFLCYHVQRFRLDRRDARRDYGPIPFVTLEDLSPAFKQTPLGPSLSSEIVFLSTGDQGVPGGTTDYECAVLSVLAKNSRFMFEFGTCTGRTSYLWARNSSEGSQITTITLHPAKQREYQAGDHDEPEATRIALAESAFKEFYYSGSAVGNKITQLFGDSKAFDFSPYSQKCDLIFIDGSHTYSYVKSDTENALKMIKPGGLILWHDYNGPRSETKDVFEYLNELAERLPLRRIKHSSFVVYKKETGASGE